MKIKSSKILVLISTLIVGFLIVNNFNEEGSLSSKQLSASEYKKIVEEKNKLISQISSLAKENKEMEEKIEKYIQSEDIEEIVEDMKNQLSDYGMVSGLNEVKGPGVVITINDGKYTENDSSYTIKNKIFHDEDAEHVLNEIKNAGAEAISVNDHRIVFNTGIKCRWAFLGFEDGDEVYPVFNFYAIGDSEVLLTELTKEGSYLNSLIIRGLEVNIKKREEITLTAGNIASFNYAKEKKK